MTFSWLEIPTDSDFSLRNIPFGAFSPSSLEKPRCGTALGNYVVDLSLLGQAGLFHDIPNFSPRVFDQATLNAFVAYPKPVWVAVRQRIIDLFQQEGTHDGLRKNLALQKACLHPMDKVTMHLPLAIGDYTDFYSSREHATNVGTMFRGKDNALQPNWLHLPVGYHGRSSTIYIDGTPIHRPSGQLQKDPADPSQGSIYGPCKLLDFELEMATVVGGPANPPGHRLTMAQAYDRLFGFCLMNDWSARDVQKWEYVPLGPFTAKNFATTISPWIVTTSALEEFQCPTSAGSQSNPVPLPYLQDDNYSSWNVQLEVAIQDDTMEAPATVSRSNFKNLYWNAAQQLVHHSVTGCVMQPGDLLGSGTISGSTQDSFGSLLELCWKGTRPVPLGSTDKVRKFLQDGDTVIMTGWSEKEGYGRVGFGRCAGKILPAQVTDEPEDANEDTTVPPSVATNLPRYRDFKLYSFWKSSSSWRVRIALTAKSIPFQVISVNLKEDQHLSAEHVERNPMAQVPVLEFTDALTNTTVRLSQSIAMIEFLEDAFPTQAALLPLDPLDRAKAREMVEVINAGTQPLQNLPLVRRLETQSKGHIVGKEWAVGAIAKGLGALESLVANYSKSGGGSGGPYCLGGFSPSLVDVCLVPQLYNARFFGVDVASVCPRLVRIEAICAAHPWFVPAHADVQPDAPREG